MDNNITFVVALTAVAAAIIYVTIRNKSGNQERKDQEKEIQERDIEFVIYKIEMDELEKQLRRKEISKEKYEKLRKNVEEQHQKNMSQFYKM